MIFFVLQASGGVDFALSRGVLLFPLWQYLSDDTIKSINI